MPPRDDRLRRTPKTPVSGWVDAARYALIEEGAAGLKVDRLAARLKVSRGGFYHWFADRNALVPALLDHWRALCVFLPIDDPEPGPDALRAWLDRLFQRLIAEDGYDPAFDMSVREWSRADLSVAEAVRQADAERVHRLERVFVGAGRPPDAAAIRARVLYYHQIGYYAIGVCQTRAERRRWLPFYLEILRGTA